MLLFSREEQLANNSLAKTIICTVLALIAFAANSVLCRLALGNNAIDASSFTAIRLLSGIAVLLIILSATRNSTQTSSKGSWTASFLLFVYALAFSYAYVSLDTGTGALILAGSVQMAMILLSIFSGTRLHFVEWVGLAIACTGFVYLVLPGVTTPSTSGLSINAWPSVLPGPVTKLKTPSGRILSSAAPLMKVKKIPIVSLCGQLLAEVLKLICFILIKTVLFES